MRIGRFLRSSVLSHDVHSGIGSGKEVSVWLHGILGHKKNWRTCSRKFLNYAGDIYGSSVVPEYRGHGESHGFSGPNTVAHCAVDLKDLFQHLHIEPALVCAHSFGGKVILKYLEDLMVNSPVLPKGTGKLGRLRHVWVLDSLPGKYPTELNNGPQSVQHVMGVLRDLPPTFKNRMWLINHLKSLGISDGIAQWLGTSVIRVEDPETGLRSSALGFDTDVVFDLFHDFVPLDLWSVLDMFGEQSAAARAQGEPFPTLHYLRAGQNPTWTPDILDRFETLQHETKGKTGPACI